MNNVELYHRSNNLQKRDAQQCLEEYVKEIKWKKCGASVIDIGCGDGGITTSILKTFLPDNFKALVGCDINEENIQFANEHHATDRITFTVLDLVSDLPDQLREKFNHAFSFHALQWINHHEIAFSNIYNLLERGGDCLLMFVGYSALYESYRRLACSPRWNYWMKDVEQFVSPYYDSQDPEKDVKTLMTAIGFTNVMVKSQEKVFVYTDLESFKNFVISLNYFKVPLEMEEEFFNEIIKMFYDMNLIVHHNNDTERPATVSMKYQLIVACGRK